MPTIEDRRKHPEIRPWGYVVCTDSFLSGWGGAAGGRSLYALAVADHREAELVMNNACARGDMRRPRIVSSLQADGTPKLHLRHGDHLTVTDRGESERWYTPHGFCKHGPAQRSAPSPRV